MDSVSAAVKAMLGRARGRGFPAVDLFGATGALISWSARNFCTNLALGLLISELRADRVELPDSFRAGGRDAYNDFADLAGCTTWQELQEHGGRP